MRFDALLINSYGGSLVLAARDAGFSIRGSYEDTGYGVDIQRLNFSSLDIKATLAEWPTQDLSNTLVFAHPPCKSFSVQNNNRRGTLDEAFSCHKNVMRYVLGQRAATLAIESVLGALEGARTIHDAEALRFGYVPLRLIQNACTFGIPQWRPRFWIIFVRKDLYRPPWTFNLRFNPVSAGSLITQLNETLPVQHPFRRLEERLGWQRCLLREHGFPEHEIESMLSGGTGFGKLSAILKRKYGLTESKGKICAKFCQSESGVRGKTSSFEAHALRVVDPNELFSTLLFDSWWVCRGKTVSQEAYKKIMGFPVDYQIPEERLREFLSRGVCPPVARWLMGEIVCNLTGSSSSSGDLRQELTPDRTADFLVSRRAWATRVKSIPLTVVGS